MGNCIIINTLPPSAILNSFLASINAPTLRESLQELHKKVQEPFTRAFQRSRCLLITFNLFFPIYTDHSSINKLKYGPGFTVWNEFIQQTFGLYLDDTV